VDGNTLGTSGTLGNLGTLHISSTLGNSGTLGSSGFGNSEILGNSCFGNSWTYGRGGNSGLRSCHWSLLADNNGRTINEKLTIEQQQVAMVECKNFSRINRSW